MCPRDLVPVGKSENCSLSSDGTLSIPDPVMADLGWSAGDHISVKYIDKPLTLLLTRNTSSRATFKVSYLTRRGTVTTGGKLNCRRFARHVARPRVVLPQRNILPLYLHDVGHELALLLEQPSWVVDGFTLTDVQAIAAHLVGVYELLDVAQITVRVGQGQLQNRLRSHLKNEELVRAVQFVRYLECAQEDAPIIERILLKLYEAEHGQLPRFNLTHS